METDYMTTLNLRKIFYYSVSSQGLNGAGSNHNQCFHNWSTVQYLQPLCFFNQHFICVCNTILCMLLFIFSFALPVLLMYSMVAFMHGMICLDGEQNKAFHCIHCKRFLVLFTAKCQGFRERYGE